MRIASRPFALLLVAATGLLAAPRVSGGSVTDYAVFGVQGVSIDFGGRVNGVVASNGNLAIGGGGSSYGGLQGGGSLRPSTGGFLTVNADVTFNGDVTTGGLSVITGRINAGGNLEVDQGTRTAAIVAAGNVTMYPSAITTGSITAGGNFSNAGPGVVNGDVAAAGSATIGGRVNGNVTYGTTATVSAGAAVTGSLTHGSTTAIPATYSPTRIPMADTFTAGGADVIAGGSAANPLTPGSYGALNITTFSQLYLTAGDYYFKSFNFAGFAINLLNVGTNSHINIFVTGDYNEASLSPLNINGHAYSAADAALGADVRIETLGNFTRGDYATGIGTVFAPNGNVSIGINNQLAGQIIAGGQVDVSFNFKQTFVAGSATVPEPGSMALTAVGLAVAAGVARSRRRS